MVIFRSFSCSKDDNRSRNEAIPLAQLKGEVTIAEKEVNEFDSYCTGRPTEWDG